jgi:F-type H+-transporting ATPase subunit gamma
MEQLSRLKARVSNLRELQSLIRALRALAASHVQEAQSAVTGILSYVGAVEDAIAEGVGLLPEIDDLFVGGGAGNRSNSGVLIVVCAEHGFVGAFNERLLDRAEAELQALPGRKLAVVGRRGAMLAGERGLPIEWSFPMATYVGGVLAVTRRIADTMRAVAKARIVYGAYRPGGNFEIEVTDILPLDPAILVRSSQRSAPLHHLPPATLLQRLASEYLFAEITRAVMQSLASENGARLRVMEAADHNIGDKLENLTRTERALRQEAITAELLDVTTGAEAVLEHPLWEPAGDEA